MSQTLPAIEGFLEQCGYDYEVWPCDPTLADTAVFCEHYGVALENSANAILVRSKTGQQKFVLCVLLATDRDREVLSAIAHALGALPETVGDLSEFEEEQSWRLAERRYGSALWNHRIRSGETVTPR